MKKVFFFSILVIVTFFFCCNKQKKNNTIIQLGRSLFFDNHLSANQTRSCGTCHNPKFAFTDSYTKSTGIYGDELKRNSRPLFNLADQHFFTAADSTIHSLEQQMNNPLFNDSPHELGMKGKEEELIKRLEADATYKKQFAEVFAKEEKPIRLVNIKKAIAAYVRSITSYNSKYDAYIAGDKNALTLEEQNGMQLFFSTKTNCSTCHGGKNFDTPQINEQYFNTGIYNVANTNSYPITDKGLYELTKQEIDNGKFKVPTIRNLTYTAPYYHDGSSEKILDVIKDYNTGGRNIDYGSNKGDGKKNNLKHKLIQPLQLTETEQKSLLAFLLTLNDSTVVSK